MSTPTETIIPEIDEIVNFFTPELVKQIDESIPKLLEHFQKVHLLDSTQVPLPDELSGILKGSGGDGSESGMKLQLMLDYKKGVYESIVITDAISADQKYIDKAVEHKRVVNI